jgi:uncharacterized ferritin-like protein (DUF455 family)
MLAIEDPRGLLHKLHHTTFRETVASEVAAMNIYEYDGLPWAFYLDMASQVEDEVRHSTMCRTLLEKRGGYLGQYPQPCYGNYYRMFWEMDLIERLVALNINTEGPGVGYLGEIVRRMEKLGDVNAAALFSHIAYDEQRHAKIGGRWLKYLLKPQERRDRLRSAEATLFLHLVCAEASCTGELVQHVIQRWETCGNAIVYEDDAGLEYEKEVPLTGRRHRQ